MPESELVRTQRLQRTLRAVAAAHPFYRARLRDLNIDTGEIRSLEAMEADMIRLALGRYRGHMTEVAKRLGIGRSTLYRKMREFGLEERVN